MVGEVGRDHTRMNAVGKQISPYVVHGYAAAASRQSNLLTSTYTCKNCFQPSHSSGVVRVDIEITHRYDGLGAGALNKVL